MSKTPLESREIIVFCRSICTSDRHGFLENTRSNPYHVVHRGEAMQHSLEAYFLVNLAADTALLALIARANECMRLRRILLSGLLAASYALLTQTVSARLEHPFVQLLLLAILSMILCRDGSVWQWSSIAIQLTGGAAMLGGFGLLLPSPEKLPAITIGSGLLLVGAVLSIRNRRMHSWEVMVTIALRGHSVSFRALIDTGNRLHEPISGASVLIAEATLLDQLPTCGVPRRRVSFGGLGGSGAMDCFHPDAVLIHRGDSFIRAPEVWIAAYPGRIPGPTRALAPPSFAVIPGRD